MHVKLNSSNCPQDFRSNGIKSSFEVKQTTTDGMESKKTQDVQPNCSVLVGAIVCRPAVNKNADFSAFLLA